MSNSFFIFKQFTINQQNTAMKVGTDGVLLGAWTDVTGAERVLDIGTGTGLIALMLAQRCSARIDAVEIDDKAAGDAKQNAENSLWTEMIQIFNESFQEFGNRMKIKYDLIVCNPPYFIDGKKAPDLSRSFSRHDDLLPRQELLMGVKKLISERGKFSVIIPFAGSDEFIKLASDFLLFPCRILQIKPVPHKEINRIIIEFGNTRLNPVVFNITIETGERHCYSKEYMELTSDFYLNF